MQIRPVGIQSIQGRFGFLWFLGGGVKVPSQSPGFPWFKVALAPKESASGFSCYHSCPAVGQSRRGKRSCLKAMKPLVQVGHCAAL